MILSSTVAVSLLIAACLLLVPTSASAQDTTEQLKEVGEQISKLTIDGVKREADADYDGALVLFNQALALAEKHFGHDSPLSGLVLDDIGETFINKGEYKEAERILLHAVGIFEKDPDFAPPSHAKALHDLAVVYDYLGDYSRAQPLYERALAIREKAFGPDHAQVAQSLNFLGNVYLEKADYEHAEQMFQRALVINQKLYAPNHPSISALLNNLAMLYDAQHDDVKAEAFLKQAIASAEKRPNPENLDLATYLNNLGLIYRTRDTAKARPLLEHSLAIREKILGLNAPDVANTLNNLAIVDWQDGDLKQAEQRLSRGMTIFQQVFGASHPKVSVMLQNLAWLYSARGETKRAIGLMSNGSDNRERNLELSLATGSEEQKRLYMASITDGTEGIVSLHLRLAPNDPEAARLSLTTILRRKGRVLDVMSGQMAALGKRFDIVGQAILSKLAGARAQLSMLVLKGPGEGAVDQYKAAVEKLQVQIQSLETMVSERATAAGVSAELVTIEKVQAAIPPDGALVEIVRYRPVSIKGAAPSWDAPRYAAYVLKHMGVFAWVDLGDAAQIDRDAVRLCSALRSRDDFVPLARAMDETVLRPIRRLLGDTRNILISPDGALNLVPFAALLDEQQHYAVENYTFTYLTSGRDLLRLETDVASKQGPLVIADPQFDQGAGATGATAANSRGSQSRGFQEHFEPLDATADEARSVSSLLTGARVLTGAQATETALKQVHGPSILHIATHGFFLRKPALRKTDTTNQQAPVGLVDSVATITENPLLRSGLALAGANQHEGGDGEDGILTAMEAAGLDLWGTKLVVLSACETGIGDVQNGEGVYGLRRALVLAGARSEMMSLWKVNDEATRDLMIDFYKRLQSGVGKSEALRQVQLKMLKTVRRNHPYFWAAFILSGDWRSLN